MFKPKFTMTPAMTAQIEEIARNQWLIENMLLMPKHEAWIHREVAIQRASATTKIEEVGDEEVSPEAVRKTVEQANANAIRAYEFIDYVSDLRDQPLDELVIRQLNREFLHGAAATLTPGVYRKGQNHVGAYRPPDQGDVPSLMRDFVEWLKGGEEHPVIAAGIAHIHMVAIHPFWDGNGRTARGLEALVLQRSDFHFKKLLSMEKRLLDVRPHYFAAIERTLGEAFGPYDATPWLTFYLMMLAYEVRGLVAQLTEWHQHLEDLHRTAKEAGILNRQADAIAFLLKAGHLTRSEYIDITGVSPVTASRDLRELVEKGLVTAEGRTSARVYHPAALGAEKADNTQPPEQMPLFDGGEEGQQAK